MRETALLFTKGQGEEVPDMGTEIPLQPVEKTMVTQVIPLAHGGLQRSRYQLCSQ